MFRRSIWVILAVALLGGGLTYLVSSWQPAEYETSTSIAALSGETGNSVVSSTLVTAPPLPQSVVQNALRSRRVLGLTADQLRASDLNVQDKAALIAGLEAESVTGRYRLLRLLASIDPQQQTGIYELRAHTRSPQTAQVLADASAQALLIWDREQAAQNINRAQRTLSQQLANVDARLAAGPGAADLNALQVTRADLREKLGQISALLTAVGGTLSLVSEAQLPRLPVSPRPLRDAALVFGALLFFASLGALLLDALRKRINSAADLAPIGKPLFGVLPRLPNASRGLLAEASEGPLFESVGFLRVNLAALTPPRRRVVVSSAEPAEGKSTVTAVLAQSIALSGARVLIVDADIYRPSQLKLWLQAGGQFVSSVPRSGGTLYTDLMPAVDLLVPDRDSHGTAQLSQMIDDLAEYYGVVLIDTPPILVAATTLELAVRVDGLLLVVASGSEIEVVNRALQSAQTVGIQVLGLVFNKSLASQVQYGYTRSYAAEEPDPFVAERR